MRYLLDTSIVSALARPQPPLRLRSRLALHTGQYAIASLVVAELRYGAERHPDPVRRARLLAFVDQVLSNTPVLPFDTGAAEWLGIEKARIEATGRVVDLADLIIAATAASHQLVIITANIRHFESLRVPAEDWSI